MIFSSHYPQTIKTFIIIPKKMFKIGNVLDWTTGWTLQKAAFFGSYIISDLQVRGL